MSDQPLMFGFGNEKTIENHPMEFISHHLIGGNPDDPEQGCWATREDAIHAFAVQFSEIANLATHQYLFVRRPPCLFNSEDGKGWRMIGRFSIAKLKEKNA